MQDGCRLKIVLEQQDIYHIGTNKGEHMPAPTQLNATATMGTPVLSSNGTSVVQTFTQTLTQAQLTQQLAQSQAQLSQLMVQNSNNLTQQANINAAISNIQAQLALFPVVPTPPANP